MKHIIPLTKTNRYKDGVLLKFEEGEQLACIAEATHQTVQRRSNSKGTPPSGRGCLGAQQRSGLGYVASAMHSSPRLADAPKHLSSLYRFVLVSGIRAWVVCLVLLLNGCSSLTVHKQYDGDSLPKEKVALIHVPHVLDVVSINNSRVRKKVVLPTHRGKLLELLPDTYTFVIRYSVIHDFDGDHEVRTSVPMQLVYNVVAGHEYQFMFKKPIERLEYEDDELNVEIWLEEISDLRVKKMNPVLVEKEVLKRPIQDTLVPKVNALDLLKVWWNQADLEQKETFKLWIQRK